MDCIPEGVKVKSLYKAVKLLDYFDAQHPERGISELAALSGMQKSGVHNIMSTYEICGLVAKNPENSKYRLGLKLLELSHVFSQDDVFRQVIRPVMEEVARDTGETVFLATPYGTQIIYREAAYPTLSISVRAINGVVAPMYCTGIGKAILAYQDEDFIERVIDEGLTAFTPNTITEPGAFREELIKIKQQGYSVDNMEHEYGIKCVGVPVRNGSREVIGAISITGPSLRFTDKKINEYAVLLIETSAKIGDRI